MDTKTIIAAITFTAIAGSGTLLPTQANAAKDSAATETPSAPASQGAPASGGDVHSEHEAAKASGKKIGAHSMIGTVEDIDTETGMVNLKTPEGPLTLHFPPKSLAQLKKGDRMRVNLSFNTIK